MNLVQCAIAGLVMIGSAAALADEAPTARFRTAQSLQQALAEPFAAAWKNANLRMIAHSIGHTRGVAILPDRRLDPTREISIEAGGESLRAFLDRLAADCGAKAAVVGNTVYLGPSAAADKVRTLVNLRQRELVDARSEVSRTRRLELNGRRSFGWNDLDTPGEVLNELIAAYRLDCETLDSHVPYDLWAASVLPDADACEALSLVLIQCDLTFGWTNDSQKLDLMPVPNQVAIERAHAPPRGMTAAVAVEAWRQAFPDLTATIERGEIRVRGTIEQHEAIEQFGRPMGGSATSPRQRGPGPLGRQRYTLTIKDAPLAALLKKLEEPAHGELSFEYDAEVLREKGIDLSQRVAFEVRSATIEELLDKALVPLGMAYRIDGRTVRISAGP